MSGASSLIWARIGRKVEEVLSDFERFVDQ